MAMQQAYTARAVLSRQRCSAIFFAGYQTSSGPRVRGTLTAL